MIYIRKTISNLPLPSLEEFDCPVHLLLTKKQTKEGKAHPDLYRYLTNKSRYDLAVFPRIEISL
ncbi:hypothetical protein DXA13_06350 [Clostridium sp. AM58-1XD]|nr:hypothetical protein DXA13_06350 [Clostridium sp. AM58-1XD]